MSGIFYGVGVGPGDPELLTMKAVRVIEECDVIAVPVSSKDLTEPIYDITGEEQVYAEYLKRCAAYQIVQNAGVHVQKKAKLYLPMPMVKDKIQLQKIHDACAKSVEKLLKASKNAAFITLGDPTVYSTCMYVYKRIYRSGYETKIIPGVPSFCAAAARLDMSLAENKEELHIIPASYEIEEGLKLRGTKVLMKAGKKIPYVKKIVQEQGMEIRMVENCGMETEKVYESADEIPDEASYYSLFILKEKKAGMKEEMGGKK